MKVFTDLIFFARHVYLLHKKINFDKQHNVQCKSQIV